MADFIRFKANGGFAMVNAGQITSVTKHIDRYDHDIATNTHTPVFDEARTNICFAGNETDYIIVDEPFEAVCDKLLSGGKPETGTWVLKNVEDPENDPYGIFKRRFYCSACGGWQTYGQTRYCPNCGKPMRCM